MLGRLAAAPAPTGALVALGGALVVLAPVGLTVGGLLEDGRATWQLAPRARPLLVGALASASAWVIALVVGAIGVAAAMLGAARLADTGVLGGVVLGSWLSALLAGAVVPWTKAGVGGQSASLGAFGVVAGLAAICAGRISAALPAAGPVPWVVWGTIGGAFIRGWSRRPLASCREGPPDALSG